MLDTTKPVQTRDGREARILATDIKSTWSIAAAVLYSDGEEGVYNYYPDGRITWKLEESDLDLVNIPKSHTRWEVWVQFPTDSDPYIAFVSDSEAKAKLWAANKSTEFSRGSSFGKLFAITQRTVTEGEGL